MAQFTAMIDMVKSAEDVKKEIGNSFPATPAAPTVAAYPYGLCLSLEEDELAKLGLDDLPNVGEMIHLCAMAKVTSVSQNEREMTDGSKKSCRRVELQITHLATESEDEENRSERWYGKGGAEDSK
jgi:hypothetical protein